MDAGIKLPSTGTPNACKAWSGFFRNNNRIGITQKLRGNNAAQQHRYEEKIPHLFLPIVFENGMLAGRPSRANVP